MGSKEEIKEEDVCPICGRQMAEGNRFCCMACHKEFVRMR
jgi:hypothetical protein